MTTFRWYVVGLLVLFGAYVALEYYKPKPLDWTPTLSSKDKIPYGTYALFDVLPQVLGSDSVASVRLPIFNQLLGGDEPELDASRPANVTFKNDSADHANDLAAARLEASQLPLTSERATYLFVNQEFTSSSLETDVLLRFLHAGNNVFIAAENIYGRGTTLADSLGFELVEADTTLTTHLRRRSRLKAATDSVRLHFLAAPAGTAPVAVTLPTSAAGYRVQLNSHAPHRGATLAADAQGRPVLVRLDVGQGHLYVCAVPLALGNYWLLKPRQGEFALAALSQLPTGRAVWWDEYQKQGRAGEQTLLRVVMAHPALKTAYYLLLLAAVLFVFVEARRRQRIIPTLRPLPNTTLLFTRTVADLYRQARGGHQQIAEKKVGLFLDYLRTRFQEPSPDLGDEAFRERLSQKAGLPRPRIDELVRMVNFARTAPAMTDRELLILSRAIHAFKRESH